MNEEAIRADERSRIAEEIRDEAHALARAGRTAAREGGARPGSPITVSAALALADWIDPAGTSAQIGEPDVRAANKNS